MFESIVLKWGVTWDIMRKILPIDSAIMCLVGFGSSFIPSTMERIGLKVFFANSEALTVLALGVSSSVEALFKSIVTGKFGLGTLQSFCLLHLSLKRNKDFEEIQFSIPNLTPRILS